MLKYRMNLILIFLLLIFFTLNFCTFNVHAFVIHIPEEVTVRGEKVVLGDIAHFQGVNDSLNNELKLIYLTEAPLPGYSQRINRELIKLVLENRGYDVQSIIFNVPLTFSVKTAVRRINIDEVVSFAENYIKENLPYPTQQIKVESDCSIQEVVIPDKDYHLEIDSSRELRPGKISVPVAIYINNRKYKRVYILLDIKIEKKAYIAKRNIECGITPARSDFELKTVQLSRDVKGLIGNWDEKYLNNKIFLSTIKKGQFLRDSLLEKPLVLKWGDNVQAVIKIGNVEINTVVKVCGRGKIGDYITVENYETNHKFRAKVVNSQLVRVDG